MLVTRHHGNNLFPISLIDIYIYVCVCVCMRVQVREREDNGKMLASSLALSPGFNECNEFQIKVIFQENKLHSIKKT